MPRKGAGAYSYFEAFASNQPAAAAYLLDRHPGESLEIQTIANRHWRKHDNACRIPFLYESLMRSGKSRTKAIREVCGVFKIGRSTAMMIVGAEPTAEERRELVEDMKLTLGEGQILDEIIMVTQARARNSKRRLNKLGDDLGRLTMRKDMNRLARVLRMLPRTNRPGRVRLRRLLDEFGRSGPAERGFAVVLSGACGLGRMRSDARQALLKLMEKLGPEGRLVARFLRALSVADPKVPKLASRLVKQSLDDGFVANLLIAICRNVDILEPHALPTPRGSGPEWTPHADDPWDDGCLMAVVSFALANPRVRVLRVPPRSWVEAIERNREIISEFNSRRAAGEAANQVISDLATRCFLSTKQIEGIVYRHA